MKELDKAYEPKKFEDKIYKSWEDSGFFSPDECAKKGVIKKDAKPFSIVLPPPNVTGTLHLGHAMMLAIEDVMIRYHRMKGDKTLWIPGTDHAAVATESKVEKMLIDGGMKKPKETLGREKFLEKVNQFAQESHDTIVHQTKKMGASLDWGREAFTLDEKRHKAVNTVFKKMFDDGLIYRGYRVINWSVAGQSTCSDDELVHLERPAKLYTFRYSKDFPIEIATTRPETKLGDTAVAVNPEDLRYKEFIGKTFTVDVGALKPLEIKIIADEEVDPEFGTGAVGVTPAHSKVDYEMYERQKVKEEPIELISVIGEGGKMNENAGKYAGLTVLEAREKFVEWLENEGLLVKTEDIMQNVGTSDRFKDVVEALPKTQWFIDVNKKFILPKSNLIGIENGQGVTLKELMQKVVQSGQIEILPKQFEKNYFHWIDNLRDWCISRQIWYGHRIPVWYKGEEVYSGVEAPEGEGWEQDPDTLDTWFSAGIWTFSALGWPDDLKDIEYHPTSVLETGYDILFFWVARMILMTTYTLGEVPFKTVYLHGLVRDEKGRKMSKSLGNIINPLDMIEKYGTDATRLSLLIGGTPGNDMKLSEEKIAGFRNFTNKLWNISRFILMNIENPQKNIKRPEPKTLADKFILRELDRVVSDSQKNMESFSLSLIGEGLREFTWGELADWYLEISKTEGDKSEILNYILDITLKLWHPFMPFVTETIWKEVYGENEILMVEKWPETTGDEEKYINEFKDFLLLQEIIVGVRAERNNCNLNPKEKSIAFIFSRDHKELFNQNSEIIKKLANISELNFVDEALENENLISIISGNYEIYLDLKGNKNPEEEKERIQKEIDFVKPFIKVLEGKLSNKSFVENAPTEVVEVEKKKLAEAKEKLEKLNVQLSSLK
ncbi:MAG: valine--tRNA ligase [Candidatus Magasanikbacteria bacterium CG_4_9_14_3_um_filter_32_9]|uniref:Valine--tRNA ligase n=1 Tax=Candidatus Magasanikbacteria bacterium CG_4_9_14_3_um_filter_32_9 TaxID=1974644 RepID=A0A2M7Z6W7_9BACT|nr:MAG: valine--tRNA ligase [Candidatus Magasanikbacteria bacterium CG_4_9_14_3_um_filter_32_9]